MHWLHKLLMQCNMLLRRDQAGFMAKGHSGLHP